MDAHEDASMTAKAEKPSDNAKITDFLRRQLEMKIPKWKRNQLGYVNSHSGLVNSEESTKKMKQQYPLADLIAEVEELEKKAKEQK